MIIFQATTSVLTSASTHVVLAGGILPSNVFWQVGTTFEIGSSASALGTILAQTSVTLDTSATLNGRALAQATVTCTSGNTITSFVSGASDAPSFNPSAAPTYSPSVDPSVAPSAVPSMTPSLLRQQPLR